MKNGPRDPASEEQTISNRLFRTTQGGIETEFFFSLDIANEAKMHENELTSAAEEPRFENEELSRKKKKKSRRRSFIRSDNESIKPII